jgi:hypothetical protein
MLGVLWYNIKNMFCIRVQCLTLSFQCRVSLDIMLRYFRSDVEHKSTRYFTILCVIFPKLLQPNGNSFNSEGHNVFGNLIWTRLLKLKYTK